MASIFTKDDKFVEKPNRNSFDLSFQNNLSLKFGKLVPCFCQEVIPGDSFRIQPTFGLRFLPQVFPVQTRMRANIHFFYVRNRTLWKDWMDFIGKTKSGLTLPYLEARHYNNSKDVGESSLKESSLYDYMGLPVVMDAVESTNYIVMSSRGIHQSVSLTVNGAEAADYGENSLVPFSYVLSSANEPFIIQTGVGNSIGRYHAYVKPIRLNAENGSRASVTVGYNTTFEGGSNYKIYFYARLLNVDDNVTFKYGLIPAEGGNAGHILSNQQNVIVSTTPENGTVKENYVVDTIVGYILLPSDPRAPQNTTWPTDYSVSLQVNPRYNRNYPLSGLSSRTLPYGSGDWQYRINALPFRAYEAVYNSFYRNPENNPFKINGVPEYNKYVHSQEGGVQYFDEFSLFDRNWEDDAFTTAVPSPQQGDAPLIGLTGTPNSPVILHYQDDNDNIGQLHLTVNSEGHVVMLEHGNDAPPTLVNGLNDMINFGITINDLRNINAFTFWKEKNVRRGYKYPDQLLSHYGVSIEYNELLMPEFIGGVSRDVTVNQISQTVETSTGNLGDMAGQAYVVGEGHNISKYCDEHGYIIGILSVSPVPNYSQLIPKHFFKHDAFDYFFPEFGKIGMQPISNKEIAATASWLQNKGDETFGYQRAWYDYLANVDQVHGKFNSDFYDFLIQRKFANVPELGANFTTIKNEDLNNIFYVDDNEDKILGQIYFDVKAVRPIPLFGIPSLE